MRVAAHQAFESAHQAGTRVLNMFIRSAGRRFSLPTSITMTITSDPACSTQSWTVTTDLRMEGTLERDGIACALPP
ncbi:MAG: hypothetical protein ACREF0_04750, partial [Acetobacteraceae bacterium]